MDATEFTERGQGATLSAFASMIEEGLYRDERETHADAAYSRLEDLAGRGDAKTVEARWHQRTNLALLNAERLTPSDLDRIARAEV